MLWTALAAPFAQLPLPQFPSPTKTLADNKQFNAVTLGPGNTFSVQSPPADLQLDSFDISADDRLVFMSWDSGRLEVRDLQSGKQIRSIKPMPGPVWQVMQLPGQKELLIVGRGGIIQIIDSNTGHKIREIQTEQGRLKYDLHKVILAPDGTWVAYANEENGKVLDIKSDPPKVLADLGDGYDIALTPDKSALWILDRDKIFGLQIGDWKPIGSSALIDKVALTNEPTLAIISDSQGPLAFIPSQSGLLRYDLKTVSGSKTTNSPTYWVGADHARNQVLVNEYKAFSLYQSDGSTHCSFQQRPVQDRELSESGEWLGSRNFGKVEMWSVKALTDACVQAN
jgi:hypothetical protein